MGRPSSPARSLTVVRFRTRKRGDLAGLAAIQIIGPQHSRVLLLFALGREPRQIELLPELDSELASLSPAHGAGNGTYADDIDHDVHAGRDRGRAFDLRAHRGDVAKLHLHSLAVDAAYCAAHQAVARLTDALKAVGFDADRVG